jgi:D-alanyl-D-alanine carboxypeptidase/D-alanyl-D-alanine-endopeptidase (penicillin-binding protein 4)
MLGIAAAILQNNLSAPLEDPKLNGAIVTAIVCETNGKVLFQKNADLRVMPASNQKLLTCAYALNFRGDFKPKTQFWLSDGEVTVAAEGDATLTSEQLAPLRDKVSALDVRVAKVWQAYQAERPDTWQIGDAPNRYGPATHAFSIDKSGFELWATPKGIDFRPHRPFLSKFQFDESGEELKFEFNPLASSLFASGKLPAKEVRLDTCSDPNPCRSAVLALAGKDEVELQNLKNRPEASPDVVIEGPPVNKMIAQCLQPSDNNLAEHLVFLGTQEKTRRAATSKIAQWLQTEVGWEKGTFNVADGSGLSRKNIVTARNISKLLVHQYQRKTQQLWLNSMASNTKGTLAKRLKNVDFFGKTGTLDMVSALSGYVKCKNGSTKIVSVILNHYSCSSGEAQQIIDRFIENVSR